MQKMSPQELFFHRNFHPSSRENISDLPKMPLVVQPSSINIHNYAFQKISVVKVTLHNEGKIPKKFTVTPPKKTSNFSIQCPDIQVGGKETVELYLWFNPQKDKQKIEDELSIKVDNDPTTIFIPIFCYPKLTIGKTLSSKILSSKDNLDFTDRSKYRKSTVRKRKSSQKTSILMPSNFAIQSNQMNQRDTRSKQVIQFEEKFRKISEYVNQKYVKNQVYHGAKPFTQQKRQQIKRYHLEVVKTQEQKLLNEVTQRFQTKLHAQGPIANSFTECNVTWSGERNIPQITFQLGMKKIQQQIRKQVISMRFQKIQVSLRFFQEYRLKEQKMGRKFKIVQYIDQHAQRVKDAKNVSDFELEFDRNSVKPIFLPLEPEFKTFSEEFEVTQRIGFDNWVTINIVQPGYWEIYGEEYTQIPPFLFHHEQIFKYHRKGGPQEMHYRQATPELTEDFDDLSPIFELVKEQNEDKEEEKLPNFIFKPEHQTYRNTDIPDQINQTSYNEEQYFLQLGPLRPCDQRKKTYTSIDRYGLITSDSELNKRINF